MKRKQSGLSLVGFLVVLAVVGFAAYVGMKLFPMYQEYYSVQSAMKGLANEPGVADMDPAKVQDLFFRRDSILADALEAVVAAIYLDAGYEACRAVVLPWFEQALAALPEGRPEKDAKTRLQEWLQARQRPLPVYELVSESGEEHAKLFLARCTLTEPDLSAQGQGSSRRLAEQAAAAAALEALAPLPRQA